MFSNVNGRVVVAWAEIEESEKRTVLYSKEGIIISLPHDYDRALLKVQGLSRHYDQGKVVYNVPDADEALYFFAQIEPNNVWFWRYEKDIPAHLREITWKDIDKKVNKARWHSVGKAEPQPSGCCPIPSGYTDAEGNDLYEL